MKVRDRRQPFESSGLESFPLSIVDYRQVAATETPFPDTEPVVEIRSRIDERAYRDLADSLQSYFADKSLASGSGSLGLPSATAVRKLIDYDLAPRALSYAPHEATRENQGGVVIVGREISRVPWGDQDEESLRRTAGGKKTTPSQWYGVSEASAAPVTTAFRRARLLEMLPIAVSSAGESSLPILTRYRVSGGRLLNGKIHLPGGPDGYTRSNWGRSQVHLGYARSGFEKDFKTRQ